MSEDALRDALKDLLTWDHHHPFNHDTERQEAECDHCKAISAAKRALRGASPHQERA